MRVPFQDLRRYNQQLADELRACLNRVLESGWYVCGKELEAFEGEFAAYVGAEYCVGVANGTDAIELALRGIGVQRGDGVATVANAGMYATTAILRIGAIPIYVDIDPRTMTMCPASLGCALRPGTRAVVVTHLYGQAAAIEEILETANKAGLPVIEDCAQAHGARVSGRMVGSWGAAGCFSFYPTKNLGALGDGGAVILSDVQLRDRVRSLRQYGWREKYHAELQGGINSRLDELQAAVLRVKLPHVDAWNGRRRMIAQRYNGCLGDLGIELPDIPGESHVAHLYVIRTSERDQLRRALAAVGIGTEVHFPIPDYRQVSVQPFLNEDCHLPVTEEACRSVLSLPCFPEMCDEEVGRVIEATRKVLTQGVMNV